MLTRLVTDRPDRLHYRAKDGIFETTFDFNNFTAFVDRALRWSFDAEAQHLSSTATTRHFDFALLDTFLSDTLEPTTLARIFESASELCPARILLVDPTCDFAKLRAKAIGQDLDTESKLGISKLHIAVADVVGATRLSIGKTSYDDILTGVLQFHEGSQQRSER